MYIFAVFGKVPNFNKDIFPIISNKCAICHNQKGHAPFPLQTYEDLVKHEKMIKHVVASKIMPPWPADNHYVKFQNCLSLSENEVSKIINWIDHGLPRGTDKIIRDTPVQKTLQLNYNTLSLGMKSAFIINPGTLDTYLRTAISNKLNTDSIWVIGYEMTPGNKQVLHHFELFGGVDDGYDYKSNVNVFDSNIVNNDYFFIDKTNKSGNLSVLPGNSFRFITAWLPGVTKDLYPVGTGNIFTKDFKFYFLNHYSASTVSQTDSSYINIFYLKNRPKNVAQVKEIPIIDPDAFQPNRIFIKANKIDTIELKYTVQNDIALYSIHPHAHLLASQMLAYAVTPDKDTIKLLSIPEWNFNWQFSYRYEKYVFIPKNSIIHFRVIYNNTDQNPQNPNHPPADVYSSFNAKDEMMVLFLNALDYTDGLKDEKVKYYIDCAP